MRPLSSSSAKTSEGEGEKMKRERRRRECGEDRGGQEMERERKAEWMPCHCADSHIWLTANSTRWHGVNSPLTPMDVFFTSCTWRIPFHLFTPRCHCWTNSGLWTGSSFSSGWQSKGQIAGMFVTSSDSWTQPFLVRKTEEWVKPTLSHPNNSISVDVTGFF